MANVREIGPCEGTLVYDSLPDASYRDGFEAKYNDLTFDGIDDFARRYFASQPWWWTYASLSIASRKKIEAALKESDLQLGTAIGSWQVALRDSDEIVFAQDMGFMEYRFGMRILNKNTAHVSTVCQLKGLFSKAYFAGVQLMHKPLVRLSLRNVR